MLARDANLPGWVVVGTTLVYPLAYELYARGRDERMLGGHTGVVRVVLVLTCPIERGFATQSLYEVGVVGVELAVRAGGYQRVVEDALAYELVTGAVAPEVVVCADAESAHGMVQYVHYLFELRLLRRKWMAVCRGAGNLLGFLVRGEQILQEGIDEFWILDFGFWTCAFGSLKSKIQNPKFVGLSYLFHQSDGSLYHVEVVSPAVRLSVGEGEAVRQLEGHARAVGQVWTI
jgi:hypothetical protein